MESFKGNRILVVDDIKQNRELLLNLFSGMGIESAEASNGAEAVTKATRYRFNVIIMDIEMPIKDGIKATRELRESGNDCIIVGFSGNVHPKLEEECKGSGMNHIFAKPQGLMAMLNYVKEQVQLQTQ